MMVRYTREGSLRLCLCIFIALICPLQDASACCWRLGLEDVMVTTGWGICLV